MDSEVVGKGKYRPYRRSNYFEKGSLRCSWNEWILGLVLQCIVVSVLAWNYWGVSNEILEDEEELWSEIENVMNGKFFILKKNMPLIIQIMAAVSNRCCMGIEDWRIINDIVVSIFVSDFYKLLRGCGVSIAFGLFLSISLTQIALFQSIYHTLNLDIYELHSILNVVIFMRRWRCTKQFTFSWYKNLIMISISVCFLLGCKFSGIVIWMWLLVISVRHFWRMIEDLEITSKQLLLHFGLRSFFFVVVPISFLAFSYDSIVRCFTISGPDISFVSPRFQHYVLHENMDQPEFIYYGSTVTIRHQDTFGGFLRGHNISYPDSNENLVTVSHENSDENEWIVEPSRPKADKNGNNSVVKNSESIKLRHKKTGKLLRASEEKPPISVKDYDKRVSTTGDSEYVGEADEIWSIKIKSPHSTREPLMPFNHLFSLRNRGRNCNLISHFVQSDDWANNEQEVLCLDSPSTARTLMYFQSSSIYESNLGKTFKWPDKTSRWKLISEYFTVQYHFKNRDSSSKNENIKKVENTNLFDRLWPPRQSLGKFGKVLNIFILISVVIQTTIIIHSVVTYNMFDDKIEIKKANVLIKEDQKMEAYLAWIFYLLQLISAEKISVENYIPSLVFGIILMTQYCLI